MATTPAAAPGVPQSAFWQFSLAYYARPQVAGACLELQDHAGIDVNLLLYLLFLAAHNREVGRDDVARIDSMVAAWREQVVLPLRNVRRQLKPGIPPCDRTDTDQLRSAVKRIELDAERIEQESMERLAAVESTGHTATSQIDTARGPWLRAR